MKMNVNEVPMSEFRLKSKRYSDFSVGEESARFAAVSGNSKALPYMTCTGYSLSGGKIKPFVGYEKVTVLTEGEKLLTMHLRCRSKEGLFCTERGIYLAREASDGKRFREIRRICNGKGDKVKIATATMGAAEKEVSAIVCGTQGQESFCFDGQNLTPLYFDGGVLRALSVCYACERMFFATENAVYYSEVSVPQEIAGRIDFEENEGLITDMVAMNKEIILLRDGRITSLRVNANDDGFEVTSVQCATGKYIFNTACIVGNYLLFACIDGVYCFDGNKVKKLDVPFYGNADRNVFSNIGAGRYGRYYVLTYTDRTGEKGRCLFIDPVSGDMAEDDFAMKACGEECFVYGNCAIYITENGDAHGDRMWRSIWTDFGLGIGEKTIKKVVIHGHGTILLTIESDIGKLKTENICLDNGESCCVSESVQMGVRGRMFRVTLQGECEVDSLTFSVLVDKAAGR